MGGQGISVQEATCELTLNDEKEPVVEGLGEACSRQGEL